MAAFEGWREDLLAELAAPQTTANMQWLQEWHLHEQSPCLNNPVGSTYPYAGSSVCGSRAERSYPTPRIGTLATVAELVGQGFSAVVAALRSGNPFTYTPQSTVLAQLERWQSQTFVQWLEGRASGTTDTTPSNAEASHIPGVPANTGGGWHELTLALAAELPRDLKDSQRLTAATRRILARKR